MVAEWDPRYFEVWPISAPTEEECDRHFLWRFWQKLPGSQDINVFDRSWYGRSEEHTSELQSLMRTSYAVFCLKQKNKLINKNIQQESPSTTPHHSSIEYTTVQS